MSLEEKKQATEDIFSNVEDKTKNESTEQTTVPSEELLVSNEEQNKEIEILKAENESLKDKYLRLYSEFENFRKRNAKEKTELIKYASEEIIKTVLPVIDDLERAIKAINQDEQNKSLSEGITLIYNKLVKELETKGLKAMVSVGEVFNPEFHEAITQVPVEDETQKGKVIDEVEKGYFLYDKVIRFAKVVTGA